MISYMKPKNLIFSCEKCNSVFDRKFNLERHDSFHCNNNKEDYKEDCHAFICNFCKKIFVSNSKLNRHLKSLRGDCYKLRNKDYNIKQVNDNNRNKDYNIKQVNDNNKNKDYNIEQVDDNNKVLKKKKYKRKKITQSTRIKIAASQMWKCKHCDMLFNEGGWDINHIVRVSLGGSNELSNLEALCKNCHGIVTINERIRDGL